MSTHEPLIVRNLLLEAPLVEDAILGKPVHPPHPQRLVEQGRGGHRDMQNMVGKLNHAIALGSFSGGRVWIETMKELQWKS